MLVTINGKVKYIIFWIINLKKLTLYLFLSYHHLI